MSWLPHDHQPGTLAEIVGPDVDGALVRRMVQQCYRDFMSAPQSSHYDARWTCMHLLDQLVGVFDQRQLERMLADATCPGRHGPAHAHRPSEQGAADLARYGVID